MLGNQQLCLRPVEAADLPRLWELIYKDEQPEWKKWDAPYYPHKAKTYDDFLLLKDDWIEHLFTTLPLVRVGFTTWSGNERMIRVGEKLGMQLEARIRKVRYYDGTYYDSIRMGLLREEWEQLL
ncbi:GNAT family N-acetyltransferase [Caryophanon latum]|uniref:N-acetyltransferase domain-containing protein n=1 Tax=Caryophanon latum TaxID=33977 RepID=A0A1C0YQ70_9BACL|nr:GNAT family protein [Caryophanon latum]OCS89219.1 hypothetical protein A6K76_12770 [Caryophanon latum]